MDQGILEALKRRYKKYLTRHIIIEDHLSELSIPEIVKRITIKDAVYWSAQSWDEATPESLAMGWNKLLPISDFSLDHKIPYPHPIVKKGSFTDLFRELGSSESEENYLLPQDWIDENDDRGYQILADDEIVSEVLNLQPEVDKNVNTCTVPESCVSPAQACEALETVLEWLESQGDVELEHLLLVKKWRNKVAEKRAQSSTKQSSI